ncbi:hypothetical protein [Thermodesulfovibrio sp. 3462-1]|uniref:Uncharacterized protein n=1 Tax=Thermodesulfovibrio obliviosus TaxID=3118332 RepID=A0AAU8GZB0_9BACT
MHIVALGYKEKKQEKGGMARDKGHRRKYQPIPCSNRVKIPPIKPTGKIRRKQKQSIPATVAGFSKN